MLAWCRRYSTSTISCQFCRFGLGHKGFRRKGEDSLVCKYLAVNDIYTFLHAETSFTNMANALEEAFTRPSFSSFQDRLSATPDATLVSEHFLVSKLSRPSIMTNPSLLRNQQPRFHLCHEARRGVLTKARWVPNDLLVRFPSLM